MRIDDENETQDQQEGGAAAASATAQSSADIGVAEAGQDGSANGGEEE